MNILIDNANYALVMALFDAFPYDGVTTNPTILSREPEAPMALLKRLREDIPSQAQLHVQVVSTQCDAIVSEARHILDALGENTFVKIPVSDAGLRAMRALKGAPITATAIFTPMQAFLAAKLGARYVAPYVTRITNEGGDGMRVAMEIHDMLRAHSMPCDVLAASFSNVQQAKDLCVHGIGAVTLTPPMLDEMTSCNQTGIAIDTFARNFAKAFGAGRTMCDD